MLIEVTISDYIFPGFYNTDYDPGNLDEDEERTNKPDYEDYQNRICQEIIDIITPLIPFEIKSWDLNSPPSYNYRNDELRIIVDTTPEQILYTLVKCNHASFSTIEDYVYFDDYRDNEYHIAILEHIIEMEVRGELGDNGLIEQISDQLWI